MDVCAQARIGSRGCHELVNSDIPLLFLSAVIVIEDMAGLDVGEVLS